MYSDYDSFDDDRSMFADPGGRSALRRATKSNPRNLPCPRLISHDITYN